MFLISRARCIAKSAERGFTLIELAVTVTLISIIVVPLTGVVIEYFKTTVASSARLSESHDVQFAAAYWQRDVASIGVRSNTFNNAANVHTFELKRSVSPDGSLATCALPTGTPVITLKWSSYALDLSANPTQTLTTVTYVASPVTSPSGVSTYQLIRRLCSGSTVTSTAQVADHLTSLPVPSCFGGGVTGCSDTTDHVPTKITLPLTSTDPNNNDGTTYQQTLLGERRQT